MLTGRYVKGLFVVSFATRSHCANRILLEVCLPKAETRENAPRFPHIFTLYEYLQYMCLAVVWNSLPECDRFQVP